MIWTGFLIGILGSFHCVGMCGPIALALPIGSARIPFLLSRIYYNFGRIITYTLLGLFVGIFGQALHMAGWQQAVSIASGVIILLAILLNGGQFTVPGLSKGIAWLKKRLGLALSRGSATSYLSVGLFNGLLPCGFVYLALAGSVNASTFWQSGLYMSLFGMGTFPMMLALSFSGKLLSPPIRGRMSKAVPYLAACLAILFILRGLNLGIPYLSPKLWDQQTEVHVVECH